MAHSESNGGADADGGEQHDHVGETEHGFRQALAELHHGPAPLLGYLSQSDAEQDAEDYHLQYLAFRNRLGDVFRKDMQNDFSRGRARWSRTCRGRSACLQLYPGTGFADVDGRQSNQQGQGGDNLKINDGLDAHAPDFLEIGVAGNSADQGSEEQGSDDKCNQTQKNLAQDFQVRGGVGPVMAKFRPSQHADQDPGSQGASHKGVCGQSGYCDPARRDQDRFRNGQYLPVR